MIQAIIIQNSTIQACLSSQVSGYGILPPIGTHNTSNDSLYLAQSNPHPYSVALQVVQEDKKRSLPPLHSCLLHIAS